MLKRPFENRREVSAWFPIVHWTRADVTESLAQTRSMGSEKIMTERES